MALLIMQYISDLEGLMESWIPVFIASYVAISADSLPSIPTCIGWDPFYGDAEFDS